MTDDERLGPYELFQASRGIEACSQLSLGYFELDEFAAAPIDEASAAEIMRQLTDEE